MNKEQELEKDTKLIIEFNPKNGSSNANFLKNSLFEFNGNDKMNKHSISYKGTSEILMKKGKQM